jgi:exosome complex exonuclease DIS3/RRP44
MSSTDAFGPNLVVREHYLRSDIPCGSELCDNCEPLYSALADGQLSLPSHEDDDMEGNTASRGKRVAMGPVLSREGRKRTSAGKTDEKGHYLILDTNVALAQVKRCRICSVHTSRSN